MSAEDEPQLAKTLTPRDLQGLDDETRRFALEVLNGLATRPRTLPTKYLYDDEGSRIFQEIMGLEEYYLTRAETEVFERCGTQLAERFRGQALDLVELGAGDGQKTMLLLDALAAAEVDLRYVPIDISEQALRDLGTRLRAQHPGLRSEGLVAEYFQALAWLGQFTERPKLVLFLGSSLGNYTPDETMAFLRTLWYTLSHGDAVLIGFDLRKDIRVMERAYADARGVTARFNLNLLKRINRELGGDFDLDGWRFESTFNVRSGAVESFVISERDQRVTISQLERAFDFEEGEAVQTERSHKYRPAEIARMASDAGFVEVDRLFDGERRFVDALWQVAKPAR